MVEKRKHKRVVIQTTISALEISEVSAKKAQPFDIDIFDISVGGIGFHSDRLLPLNSFYNADVRLLNGESFECIIKIVRGFGSRTYTYGSEFISLSPADAYRIELYILLLEHSPEIQQEN